jgi:hypothetical protein
MFRSVSKLLTVVMLGLVVAAASPTRAEAQSATTDAVYEDVKEVIEDLLTKEVSQTVATHMACLAGRRTDGVTKETENAVDITTDLSKGDQAKNDDTWVSLEAVSFFPNTLQAIYDERYSSLKPVFLGEMSGFVGDLAYQLLQTPQPNSPAGGSGTAPAVGNETAQTPMAAKMQMSQAGLVTLMTARAALLDHRTAGTLARSATAMSAGIIYAPLKDAQLDICGANLGYMLATKQIASSGSPLDRDCSLDSTKNPTRDEYACDLAYAIQDSLTSDPTDAQSYLLRALATYVDELANPGPQPSQVQIAATVNILNDMLSMPGSTLGAVTNEYVAIGAIVGKPKDEAIDITLQLTKLMDQWKTYHLTDGQPLSVPRLADMIDGISTLVSDDCKKTAPPKACTFFAKERVVLGIDSNLWPIVRLASTGDYVDAAQLAIGILFRGLRKSCTTPEQSASTAAPSATQSLAAGETENPRDTRACELIPYVQRFADDIVVYVVQAHVDGTPTDEARSTLRAATEDLVQELGINGGIDRPTWSPGGMLLPDLALRYEWSPSFAQAGTGSARFLASLPWLKLRKSFLYTEMVYSSVAVSLTDILAPLAEQASRASGTYTHEDRLWADILAPRIDIEGGIPALSKHLLVGGGITYRFVVPSQTAPATTTAPAAYEYRSCLTRSNWSDCFQFGVFAKYTM